MQATIKCNQKTKDQAGKVLAALKNSFTSAQLTVNLEVIDYAPNPGQSMDFVYEDVQSASQQNQVEIILLDWKVWSGDERMSKVKEGTMLFNINLGHVHALTIDRIIQEISQYLYTVKVKAFAKDSSPTLGAIDDLRTFYLASEKVISIVPFITSQKGDSFQPKIIVEGINREIWVQVSEFRRVRLPFSNGWDKALYLFLLKNEEGFVFNKFNFQSMQEIKLLAEFYVSTKSNGSENEIVRLIRHQTGEGRTSKFFSPYFNRLGNKLAAAAGHLDCFADLKLISRGKRKGEEFSININWDRSAIVWK